MAKALGRSYLLPLSLVVLQGIAVFSYCNASGRLNPVRHPDTYSYFDAMKSSSLVQALSHYRAFGYPLLARVVDQAHEVLSAAKRDSFERRWRLLPLLHLLTFVVAVSLFGLGIARFSGSPWLAVASATPLLYSDALQLAPLIQPDFLSVALVIATVGLLFLGGAESSRWCRALWVVSVATLVFAAYQLRPATLFLIIWIPALGWLLRMLDTGRAGRALKTALVLAAATVLPYLAFSTLRSATVGHFGLVSFGGPNVSAVAVSLLDGKLVRSLPVEHREMALRMLRARRQRGWKALQPGADTELWFPQYNDTIWSIALPVAWHQLRVERRAGTGPDGFDRVIVNDRLTRFAREVIKRRPALYLHWVRDSFFYGVRQLLHTDWIVWPALALLPTGLAAALTARAGRRRPASEGERRTLVALWIAALTYFVVYNLLIALVSFPFERYFLSISVLLPAALLATLFVAGRNAVASLLQSPSSHEEAH